MNSQAFYFEPNFSHGFSILQTAIDRSEYATNFFDQRRRPALDAIVSETETFCCEQQEALRGKNNFKAEFFYSDKSDDQGLAKAFNLVISGRVVIDAFLQRANNSVYERSLAAMDTTIPYAAFTGKYRDFTEARDVRDFAVVARTVIYKTDPLKFLGREPNGAEQRPSFVGETCAAQIDKRLLKYALP